MPFGRFHADWDEDNSWSRFLGIGLHAENTGSWEQLPDPLPYRGGHGLIETSYAVQTNSNKNWGYGISLGAGADGAIGMSLAMRIETLDVSADRRGPVYFGSLDDSFSQMTTPAVSMQCQGGTGGTPIVRLISNESDVSPWLDLSPWSDTWMWLRFGITRGAPSPLGANKYWTEAYCDFWVLHGTRPQFIRRLYIPTAQGNRFDTIGYYYNLPVIGFVGTDETQDSYKFRVDEVNLTSCPPGAVLTGQGQVLSRRGAMVAMPKPRTIGEGDYPVEVRISRYDELTTSYVTRYTLPTHMIRDIRCRFASHRIELDAEITVASPGPNDAVSAKDVLADLTAQVGVRYRIDILAPHNHDLGEYPSQADHMVYWAGEVKRIRMNRGDDTVRISAVGFSAKLDRRVIQNVDEKDQVIDDLLDVLLVPADWPTGTLTKTTDPNSTVHSILVRRLRFQEDTVLGGVRQLLGLGEYAAGVSVSGYPYAVADEFRLHFFESKHVAEDDIPGPGTPGLGMGIGLIIDIDDPRVVDPFEDEVDDSGYANEWWCSGQPLHVDLVSVVTGYDGEKIRDEFSNGVTSDLPLDGNAFFGMQLVLLDQVFRQDDKFDVLAWQLVPGNSVGAVPPELRQGRQGSASYEIRLMTQTGTSPGYTDIYVHEFPAPEEDLTLDISEKAVRYTVRNSGMRVLRRVNDQEDTAAADAVRLRVSNDEIRGWLEAVRFSYLSRTLERRQARRLRVTVRGVQTLPNGAKDPKYNRVQVMGLGGRITRMGTVANGGDEWAMGDDDRKVGVGLLMEIESCECSYTPSGWDIEYQLGGTPAAFAPVVSRQIKELSRR